MTLNTLDSRYASVYKHRGIDICTLKIATPPADRLGYCVDHENFEGRIFDNIGDAVENIDVFKKGEIK